MVCLSHFFPKNFDVVLHIYLFYTVKPATIYSLNGNGCDRCDIDADIWARKKQRNKGPRSDKTNLQITRQTAIATPLMEILNARQNFWVVAFGSSFI